MWIACKTVWGTIVKECGFVPPDRLFNQPYNSVAICELLTHAAVKYIQSPTLSDCFRLTGGVLVWQ